MHILDAQADSYVNLDNFDTAFCTNCDRQDTALIPDFLSNVDFAAGVIYLPSKLKLTHRIKHTFGFIYVHYIGLTTILSEKYPNINIHIYHYFVVAKGKKSGQW